MRPILAAALAIPVYAALYASTLLQRSLVARVVGLLAVGAIALVAMGVAVETPVQGYVPSAVRPIAPSEFATEIRTGEAPTADVTITFPAAMDPASVAASLRVEPGAPVRLAWDPTGSVLTVSPRGAWRPATYYTVSVDAGAMDRTGRPTTRATRAAFLTRSATGVSVAATRVAGDVARLDTDIAITFERPVDRATVRVSIEPPLRGVLEPLGARRRNPTAFRFVVTDPLAPGTTYTVRLAPGIVDADGAPVATPDPLEIQTATAPAVVRFRPRATAVDVPVSQVLSVRFTEPMDEAATAAAWSATVDGNALDGSISFAEDASVLVFKPATSLPYEKSVVMSVAATALSRAGVPLVAEASATATTVAKPVVRTSGSGSPPVSVGGGTWAAVETYYLKLMNCTRTGGWVSSSGTCSDQGGRDVAALWIDEGISAKVSRPYAKLLATRGACNHFIGGTPGDRLRRAGYTSYIWAENLGCRSGDPFTAVLGSHLFFQSEKPYRGGHYVHIMDGRYDRVGLAVWVAGGRVRLVVDFYHPR